MGPKSFSCVLCLYDSGGFIALNELKYGASTLRYFRPYFTLTALVRLLFRCYSLIRIAIETKLLNMTVFVKTKPRWPTQFHLLNFLKLLIHLLSLQSSPRRT